MEPEFLHRIFLSSKNIVLLTFSQNHLTGIASCTSFIAEQGQILPEAFRKMHIIYSECDIILFYFFITWRQTGIEVKDFGRSWRSGVAFHSVIHAIRPELVDLERVKGRSNRENLEEAFTIAETELGIPRLLDPEGMSTNCWLSSSGLYFTPRNYRWLSRLFEARKLEESTKK